MTKTSRYFIIAIGLIAFIILAPLLTLYSAGMVYDFNKNELVKTGILALKYFPEKAEVYLNGQKQEDSVQTIRFLKPKDYQVEIKFPGYCAWQKTLNVQPGSVTWANAGINKITLLKNPAQLLTTLPVSVLNFAIDDDLYVLSPSTFYTFDLEGKLKESLDLNLTANNFESLNSKGKFLIYASTATSSNSYILADAINKTSINITEYFKTQPKILYGSQNQLFALESNNLYKIDLNSEQKTLLNSNVLDIAFFKDQTYFTRSTATSTQVGIFNSADFKENNILVQIPQIFQTAKLLTNDRKQMFLIGDGVLYSLDILQKKIGSVKETGFANGGNSLIYFGEGELRTYDLVQNRENLVTRSQSPLSNFKIFGALGQIFWLNGDNKLIALELDQRDKQNECEIYKGQNLRKFEINEKDGRIFLLESNQVKILDIF